jgi:lipoprotein NlpI
MKKILYIWIILGCMYQVSGQTDKRVLDAFGSFVNSHYAEAAGLFEKLAGEKSPSGAKYLFYQGLSEYQLGDYSRARVNLQKAESGGYALANLWLAKIYTDEGDPKKACAAIQNYLDNSTVQDLDAIKKDPAFRSLQNTDEWFLLWQDDRLTLGQKTYNDAAYYFSRKQFAKAHELIENRFAEKDNNAGLHALNSKVYSEEGIQSLALDEINKALQLEDTNTAYLEQKADYLEKSGKISGALEVMNNLMTIAPEDFQARYQRALLAFETEQYSLAKADMQVLNTYFNNPDYDFLLGKIDFEQGNYLSALKIFNVLMEKEQPRAEYYKARGLTYFKTGTFDQAAYDLSMSLDLTPDDAETNLYLGLAEQSRGNSDMACYYLQRARHYGSSVASGYLNSYCK